MSKPQCAPEHPPFLEQWRQTHDREKTIEGYEKKQGMDHQLIPCTHFGEKVSGEQQVHVDTDELSPGHGLLALRSGWDTMTFEDVTHRLITQGVSQIR